jgi:hypothetical protein
MKDAFSLIPAGRLPEGAIYCVAPPLNRSVASPDNLKVIASWQSALEAPSGLRQWKLRLQLACPDVPSACPKVGGLLSLEFRAQRRQVKDRFTKINVIVTWLLAREAPLYVLHRLRGRNRGTFVRGRRISLH